MDYPEAHADDLLEVFPGPVGEKSLNPRQSYKVSQRCFAGLYFWRNSPPISYYVMFLDLLGNYKNR